MSWTGFALILLTMDLIGILVLPQGAALTQSLNNPKTDEEIRRAVTSSNIFKAAVRWKLAVSMIAVALYVVAPMVAAVGAAVAYVAFILRLLTLIWRL